MYASRGADEKVSLRFAMSCLVIVFFFFNDTATTEIYTLSLHDALPILVGYDMRTWWTCRQINLTVTFKSEIALMPQFDYLQIGRAHV